MLLENNRTKIYEILTNKSNKASNKMVKAPINSQSKPKTQLVSKKAVSKIFSHHLTIKFSSKTKTVERFFLYTLVSI